MLLLFIILGFATPLPGFVQYVHTASNYGFLYAEPPASSYLSFVGEKVYVGVDIVNEGDPTSLFCPANTAAENLSIELRRDGLVVAAEFSASLSIGGVVGKPPAELRTLPVPIALKYTQAASWQLTLNTERLEPGRYVLEAATKCTNEAGESPRRHVSRYDFDLRAATSAAQPEILRRQAQYLRFEGRLKEAEAVARHLLEIHPRSFAAHEILGEIAILRKDRRARHREFNAAADILAGRQDARLQSNTSQMYSEQVVRNLRLKADGKPGYLIE